MAVNAHLTWEDITDMTPGLWEVTGAYNKFAAPPNAFVKLQDYQPLKAGGLRPFIAASSFALPTLVANEIPCGIFARNGVIRTGAGGSGNASSDVVLVTEKRSQKEFQIWRLDSTIAAPAWSSRKISAVANDDSHKAVQFALFKTTEGVEYLCMSITQNGGDDGLWLMQYDYTVASNTGNDGKVTSGLVGSSGPLIVSQSKIMIGSGATINYSDTGEVTFSGSTHGSLTVAPNRAEPTIQGMSGVEPSDILIAKEGAPWVTISGDITSASTPVREMGDDHHVRYAKQFLPKTPGGICFVEPSGRVFETDGRSFKPLTDQISGRALIWSGNMVGSGAIAFANGYLVLPGHDSDTSGLFYDFETDALWVVSALNPVFNWYDPYSGLLYMVNHVNQTPTAVTMDMLSGTRVTTGVIQTVPYADKNGRNIDIREVHLFVYCPSAYPGTELKVELIDETDASVVTRYKVVDSARRDIVRLQFPATKSDYLSVKITPTALDGVSETATIERIRIGFGLNNQIR